MTKEEREKLRELALRATPGPWESDLNGLYICATKPESFTVADTHNEENNSLARIRGWGHLQYKGEKTAIKIQKANAAHIAAANPQAILDLLDENEELLIQRNELMELNKHYIKVLGQDIEEARSKLDIAEKALVDAYGFIHSIRSRVPLKSPYYEMSGGCKLIVEEALEKIRDKQNE